MCLAGENGCGKSTLVKIISGVYTKDEGEVTFEGKKISKITPAEATQLGIQVIYQDLSIFPNLTVMENLAINSEITAGKKLVNKKMCIRDRVWRAHKELHLYDRRKNPRQC